MKLHFGKTEHDGCLRFHRGTLSWNRDGDRQSSECYFEHPIKKMFGISGAGARWFFGIIQVDGTRDVRESGKTELA